MPGWPPPPTMACPLRGPCPPTAGEHARPSCRCLCKLLVSCKTTQEVTVCFHLPACFMIYSALLPSAGHQSERIPWEGGVLLSDFSSPSRRSMASDSYPASPNHPSAQALSSAHPADHHARDHLSAAAQTQSLDRVLRPTNQPPGGSAAAGRHVASLGRTPSGHGVQGGGDPTVNGPRQQSVKEYRAGHG